MSLVGNIIAMSFAGNPAIINYDMFVAVFAMITLFYLIAVCFKEDLAFHKFIPAGLDLLNAIFWFCGAVAMAADLKVHSCSNQVCYAQEYNLPFQTNVEQSYLVRNRITNGASDMEGRCREAQATTAFLWFGWACFMVSLVLSLTSSGGANMRGSRKGPNMSQV